MEFEDLTREGKLAHIASNEYDLVVVGGGIFGACALWEATLRGLKVLLVEAEDFGSGASANSYKIVHGGIRYMQHLDVVRVWSSSRERSAFLRVAPHMVQPLPVLIPTYGWGMLGKPILGTGMLLYDLLTIGRNKGIPDKNQQIPLTRFLSRQEVLENYPDIPSEGLTGGCIFSDGRFFHPTRLIWGFVNTAMQRGADALNYLPAKDIVVSDGAVTGIQLTDVLTGKDIAVRCKSILNTAGPWAERLLSDFSATRYQTQATYSRDACFVVKRKLPSYYTLAVQGHNKDPDALLSRPARHLFISPWRDYMLVGVWHKVTTVDPCEVSVSREEIEQYIAEVNEAYPSLNLRMDEVCMWNAGLVPFGESNEGDEDLSYGKRSLVIDHAKTDNIDGLTTLVGIRYTMARGEAEAVLDIVQRKLGLQPNRPGSDFIKLWGGDFDSFNDLLATTRSSLASTMDEAALRSLLHSYGSEASIIFDVMKELAEGDKTFGDTNVTRAQVLYACRNEMVESLADLVFRRTDIATAGNPGDNTLLEIAQFMGRERDWDEQRLQQELQRVQRRFPQWLSEGSEQ